MKPIDENVSAAKASKPIDLHLRGEIIETAISHPGFMCFARILGLRIVGGKSVSALRMLIGIGATPGQAHDIIDGWEIDARPYPMLTEFEAQAVRFSMFVDDLDSYDWLDLLTEAVTAASEGEA